MSVLLRGGFGDTLPPMKQLIQHLGTGRVEHLEVPEPRTPDNWVKVRLTHSVISAGTERMVLSFGRANLVGKALSQPERVAQVVDKARTDGIAPTLKAVQGKLATPLPMGYASAGVVMEVGAGVTAFEPGDRVATNGPHAQVVVVAQTMCAPLPEGMSGATGAFATLGAIALEGIRCAAPTFGERFAVIGMGTLGVLTARLLQANGCEVVGVDVWDEALAWAQEGGVAHTVDASARPHWWQGLGDFDGVLVTAHSTHKELLNDAARATRRAGRVILVGVAPIELDRGVLYERNLRFEVSRSYGPGRQEPLYETQGVDYPVSAVRWSAGRNMQAYLRWAAKEEALHAHLVRQAWAFEQAPQAYDALLNTRAPGTALLTYAEALAPSPRVIHAPSSATPSPGRCGVIGAGNYATRVLLPALAKTSATLEVIASPSGLSASLAARAFGAHAATSDVRHILDDPSVDTVFILSRHDSHARLVCQALEAGKHVFVEKPLALTTSELERIRQTRRAHSKTVLMVGFNRRFAPTVEQLRRALEGAPAKHIQVTFNAPALPDNHWTQAPDQGARLLTEGCHAIDLVRALVGRPITHHHVTSTGQTGSVTLHFEDGSLGNILYTDRGHPSFPKERVEVFCGGQVWRLDNFKGLVRWPSHGVVERATQLVSTQDKGHEACVGAFIQAVQGHAPQPIPDDELFEVAAVGLPS